MWKDFLAAKKNILRSNRRRYTFDNPKKVHILFAKIVEIEGMGEQFKYLNFLF